MKLPSKEFGFEIQILVRLCFFNLFYEMRKIIYLSIFIVSFSFNSCSNGPTSESFDDLNTECDYISKSLEIIEYIKSEFQIKVSSDLDISTLDENQQEELCHNIMLLEMLRREVKDRVSRPERTDLPELNGSDLMNCSDFNKVKSMEDDLEDNLRRKEFSPYFETLPENLKVRFKNYDNWNGYIGGGESPS